MNVTQIVKIFISPFLPFYTDFTRLDFQNHLGMALSYLQGVVYSRPDKKIRILWRETNAQHFPTPNG